MATTELSGGPAGAGVLRTILLIALDADAAVELLLLLLLQMITRSWRRGERAV